MKRPLLIIGTVIIFVIACFLTPPEVAKSLRLKTLEFLSPALSFLSGPSRYFHDYTSKLQTLDKAQAEAKKLRQENAELQVQLQLLQDKKSENDRLREMLGFKAASPYHLRACRVSSREASLWWQSVQVDIGWEDEPDLASDQPVVTPRGVVGKTGPVARNTTTVFLLVDQNCSIPAALVPTPNQILEGAHPGAQDEGIAQGEGNTVTGQPRIKLRYLPKTSQVGAGQFVVSSGRGPFFPAGLRIGTVVDVSPLAPKYPTFGLYREAVVEPTADLNQLDELFIVIGGKDGAKATAATADDAKPKADTTGQ